MKFFEVQVHIDNFKILGYFSNLMSQNDFRHSITKLCQNQNLSKGIDQFILFPSYFSHQPSEDSDGKLQEEVGSEVGYMEFGPEDRCT